MFLVNVTVLSACPLVLDKFSSALLCAWSGGKLTFAALYLKFRGRCRQSDQNSQKHNRNLPSFDCLSLFLHVCCIFHFLKSEHLRSLRQWTTEVIYHQDKQVFIPTWAWLCYCCWRWQKASASMTQRKTHVEKNLKGNTSNSLSNTPKHFQFWQT